MLYVFLLNNIILFFIHKKYVISYKYKKTLGKTLNINKPVSLTEKIQFLKINAYKQGQELACKLKAKSYVQKLIPELKFAKVYCIAESFEQLDFSLCPKSFVLKTNHSWKTNTIIYDKDKITDIEYREYSEYYKSALNIKYEYWAFFELQYRCVEHKVFAEEILLTIL